MVKGDAGKRLRAWRQARDLTMEEAGALVVVDGKPTNKTTWHGWESKGKIPKPEFMIELEILTGIEPNDFYRRPDAGEIVPARAELQPALI